ncbi:ATP-binding response regulator [Croceicoccus mobilis]|uniref:histidine kinase n=1 Tax=Croceicoccus mobilis TaxID=1703339 RepID=A0A917DSZ4_9SPHN|nr:ATP-binding protein [Croceicoccus mobilis]GGD67333.1 hypothetical protein GCM10010990_15990 [Croceicoccus mobilis]
MAGADDRAALLERIAALEGERAGLIRERDAAQAANEAKSRFLASVSHEIRSPLNSIYGYAQLLERGEGRNALRAAQVIRRSSEHLANLVEGLLDLSQVESGMMRLSRDTIRLPALLQQIADMFEPEARAKGLEFRLDRPERLPEFVRGDLKRLRQVLINLVANAVKFTDTGHVTLKLRYRSEMAIFEIADSGIGIAPDQLEHIFDPFARTVEGKGGDRIGVGLGLSITQALVRIMGGEIEVSSEPGEGTVFTVRMMLSQPMTPPADATPAEVVTGYTGPRRTILVVDDDADQTAMVRSLLEPLGFDVATAASGDEAIDVADANRPDLVFLDITMPGRSGWETAVLLRERHGADLRIVMLSADAHDYTKGGDGDAANDMFVMKPFEFTNLLDVISTQLHLEWIGASPAAATKAGMTTDAGATVHPRLEEIEPLARTGNVRALAALVDVLESDGVAPPLIDAMREKLDAFDLKGLAALARGERSGD